MHFLLDENIPNSVYHKLREMGYDAIRLLDIAHRGMKNSHVAELATKEGRIVITFDPDFLKLKKELRKKVSVIIIDLKPRDPVIAAKLIEDYIRQCAQILKRRRKVRITSEGVLSM